MPNTICKKKLKKKKTPHPQSQSPYHQLAAVEHLLVSFQCIIKIITVYSLKIWK